MYLRLLSHAPVTHVSLFPYLLFSSVSRFVYCKLSLLLSRITFITRTMLLLSPLSRRASAASDVAALWRMSTRGYVFKLAIMISCAASSQRQSRLCFGARSNIIRRCFVDTEGRDEFRPPFLENECICVCKGTFVLA